MDDRTTLSTDAAALRTVASFTDDGRPVAEMNPEIRRALITQAAYLRAERRGFAPGHEMQDWLEAEQEVDRGIGAARALR